MENKNIDVQILDRLGRLERAVFGSSLARRAGKTVEEARGSKLPDHILSLRDTGFFDAPRTSVEVWDRLQSKYPCEPNRVAMALLRLQRRRKLRKASKSNEGRKQLAYVK